MEEISKKLDQIILEQKEQTKLLQVIASNKEQNNNITGQLLVNDKPISS